MKSKTILAVTAVSVLLAGCAKERQSTPEPERQLFAEATFSTKTVLDMQGGGISWLPGDAIDVFYGDIELGKFTSLSKDTSALTVFASEKTFAIGSLTGGLSNDYMAVYPYEAVSVGEGNAVLVDVPIIQTATPGSFSPGSFPSVGVAEDLSFAFYNVCGGLAFKVGQKGVNEVIFKANGGENIAGLVKLTPEMGSNPPFIARSVETVGDEVMLCCEGSSTLEPGQTYFLSMVPCTLSEGYTMTFSTNDNLEATLCDSTVRTIERSVFKDMGEADARASYRSNLPPLTLLSAYGVYSDTDTDPKAILPYSESEDQLTYGTSGSTRAFGIMNFSSKGYWGTVSVNAGSFTVGGTYTATVTVNGSSSTYSNLTCIAKQTGTVWLEDKSSHKGIILPIQ